MHFKLSNLFLQKIEQMQLPEGFKIRMQRQLGESFDRFQTALEKIPPVSIRINPKKVDPILFERKQVAWEPLAFYLKERPIFTLDPQFHAGAYYVQEASSMFVGYLFKQLYTNNSPLKILDLCGAPGGKSTQIASLMNDQSFLVANEVIKTRTVVLTENLIKWGNPNVVVTQNDPKDFQKLPGFFDLIIVDAPCSGEGLFRRDESAMDEWTVDNALICSQRQQRILADVWSALAPGGYLIYSTCTYNPDENEKNIAWITEQFDAESIPISIPDEWGISKINYQNIEAYQFFPFKIEGEGFFVSVLQKKGSEMLFKNKSKKKFNTPKKVLEDGYTNWLVQPEYFKFIELNQTIRAIPGPLQPWIELLSEQLRIVHSGVLLAEIKGNKLIPQHDLSMSWFLNKSKFPLILIDNYEALLYLKKENVHSSIGTRGFNILMLDKLPLGFVNNLGNRSNNNYPVNWRIRMNLPVKETFVPQIIFRNQEI